MNNKSKIRVLVNSMPKSGTFLLSRAVNLLGYQYVVAEKKSCYNKFLNKMWLGLPPGLGYETVRRSLLRHIYKCVDVRYQSSQVPIGVTSPIQVSSRLVAKWLQRVPPGQYITGHIPWSLSLDEILCHLGYKHVLIIRDPRDVLVSFLHYVSKPEHDLSMHFLSLSDDERVAFAMKGGYAQLSNRHVLGIGEAFRSIVNWKQSQNCLIVRFEDLVGEKGGGSRNNQHRIVKKISEYLGIEPDERLITHVCEKVFDTASPTFRRGKVGAWKSELAYEYVQIFNRSYTELLRELQYDSGVD